MGPPKASVGRQHTCTRGPSGLGETAACWLSLRTMSASWVAAARPHMEDLANAGVDLEARVVSQLPAQLEAQHNPPSELQVGPTASIAGGSATLDPLHVHAGRP